MNANLYLGFCIGVSFYVGLYYKELTKAKLSACFLIFIMAFIGYMVKKIESL